MSRKLEYFCNRHQIELGIVDGSRRYFIRFAPDEAEQAIALLEQAVAEMRAKKPQATPDGMIAGAQQGRAGGK